MKITKKLTHPILASSTFNSKTLNSATKTPPTFTKQQYVPAPKVELDSVYDDLNYTSHMEDAFELSNNKNNLPLTKLYIETVIRAVYVGADAIRNYTGI